jgi:Swiss Army Knife RNA repair-like protein
VKPDTRRPKPILFLDVDGVISLFGFPAGEPPPGRFHWVDGVAHCIGDACAERVGRLADRFDLVWATGWEERANEYLPQILGLPVAELPYLSFDQAIFGTAHWKVEAIDAYAGERPAAWIDDSLDDSCHRWAEERDAPTLLVETDSGTGLLDEHVERLIEWADAA